MWNNNGSGVRGDLKAVVRAILLDPEARAPRNPVASTFGKLKEPVLYVTNLLRASARTSDGVALRTPLATWARTSTTRRPCSTTTTPDYLVPGTDLSGPRSRSSTRRCTSLRVNCAYNLIYSGTCDTGAPVAVVCGPAPDATVPGAVGTRSTGQR